jgi:hypothetical protein
MDSSTRIFVFSILLRIKIPLPLPEMGFLRQTYRLSLLSFLDLPLPSLKQADHQHDNSHSDGRRGTKHHKGDKPSILSGELYWTRNAPMATTHPSRNPSPPPMIRNGTSHDLGLGDVFSAKVETGPGLIFDGASLA